MASRKRRGPQITDVKIMEALNLFKDTDSVELKLTVADVDRASVIAALDLDLLDAELRQVVFFDTPDMKLNHEGVVVRARRFRKGGDIIVKRRPVVPANLSSTLRRSSSFTVEVDVMPCSFVCSGSVKGKVNNGDIREVLKRERPIRKLLLPEQQSLYKKHAPKGLELDSLLPFGPINVAKLKFSPDMTRHRVAVAELWFYPDGSRILELSTKCSHDDACHVLAEMRAYLTSRGVPLDGEQQQTKTQKALEYFSRLHRSNGKKAA